MTQTRMSRGLHRLAALLGLLAAAPAAGDMIKLTNGLRYEPVTVTAVGAGTIQFRTAGGLPIKRLADLAAVNLTGETLFNRAEGLLGEGKHAEAAAAYALAYQGATIVWKKTLIRYRHMTAAEAAGQIDEALRLWLELADGAGGDKGVLALRPRKLAPKASPANERAIGLLKAKSDQVKATAYRDAILQGLVDLYERQGRLKEAQAIQATLAGRVGPPSGAEGNGPSSPAVAPPTGSANAQLRLAGLLLKRSQYDKVVSTVQPTLTRLTSADLPAALYMLGRAQLELAGQAPDEKDARKLVLVAGLNLMRVVVFFPDGQEAPHALLLAGQANEKLGNYAAARSAYAAVIRRFSATPAAESAQAAMARIKGK